MTRRDGTRCCERKAGSAADGLADHLGADLAESAGRQSLTDGMENTAARSKVAGIIDRARERNLDRAAELADWAATAESGRLSAENRMVAAEVAHQLAGSAGTFGYRAATDIAREVERLFADGEGAQHWARTGERIRDLAARLHEPPELDGVES